GRRRRGWGRLVWAGRREEKASLSPPAPRHPLTRGRGDFPRLWRGKPPEYDRRVDLSRRRLAAGAAFALLALAVEVTGRALTARLDAAFNVAPLATPTTPYYPFLLPGVRALAALVVGVLVRRPLRLPP